MTRQVGEDAKLAAGITYTENGQRLEIGDGLWATADRLGAYRHDFLDPEAEQAGCFTTIFEGQVHSIMFLRLAMSGGLVSAIETLVARPGLGGGGPFAEGARELDRAGNYGSSWDDVIPADRREDRASLINAANRYFSALEGNDGRGDYSFFADDCIRIENGFRTTDVPPASGAGRETPYAESFRALSARAQFETGFFRFVTSIRDRRFPIINVSRGLVVAFAFFDHTGTLREYELADGTPITGAIPRPFTWQIAEAFRVEAGRLRRIEALMIEVPYGTRSAWPVG